MRKYLYIVSAVILPILFNSCLKYDIDEAEYSTDCDVTSVAFEHRWAAQTGKEEGIYTLYFKQMAVKSNIDKESQTIDLDITVPAADNSYPQSERDKTSLTSIACSFVVSNAANVAPLNGAPQLGTRGDYSGGTFTYRITSASGVFKDWRININSFDK
jgi:hypothetical protein